MRPILPNDSEEHIAYYGDELRVNPVSRKEPIGHRGDNAAADHSEDDARPVHVENPC